MATLHITPKLSKVKQSFIMSIDTVVQNFKQSTSGQLVSAVQHLEVESSEGCLLTYLVVDAGCQRGASVLPHSGLSTVSLHAG